MKVQGWLIGETIVFSVPGPVGIGSLYQKEQLVELLKKPNSVWCTWCTSHHIQKVTHNRL